MMGLQLHSTRWLFNCQHPVGLPPPSFSSKVTRGPVSTEKWSDYMYH